LLKSLAYVSILLEEASVLLEKSNHLINGCFTVSFKTYTRAGCGGT
jgi:hypothetical protein